MSVKEQVKTTIDLIKTAFFSLLTALFGIFAFVVVNFNTINTMQMIICGIGASLVIIIFAILLYYLVKNVKKLGDIWNECAYICNCYNGYILRNDTICSKNARFNYR